MIKKQNLLFLTLFSLILVLGVYYVTMPDELFIEENDSTTDVPVSTEVDVKTSQNEYLTALQVELEDERQTKKANLEEILNSSETTTEEKNNAYLELKYLSNLQGQEELLEKKINETFSLDSFIEINNNDISVVIADDEHDVELANNIMKCLQKEYDEKMTISVKFQS